MESLEELGIKHHSKGTVVSVEGPRFSTKAESNMYRLWGADVINMTSVPEVFDLCPKLHFPLLLTLEEVKLLLQVFLLCVTPSPLAQRH